MFGTYRTILALAVLANHLISIHAVGYYAVHGFFILSGYLMTFIMSHSYGYRAKGIKSFAINRFLRLYPSYWAAIAISIVTIVLWGEDQSRMYREFIFVPDNLKDWIQNLTLVFANLFPARESPRLSPPTWALTTELFFYFLIAIGLSKTKTLALVWLACSAVYMAATHWLDLDFSYRYGILFAGSLPFAIGASIYHFRETLCAHFNSAAKPWPIVVFFSLFVANGCLGGMVKHFHWDEFWFYLSFYLNYLIHTGLIVLLIQGKLPVISRKLDQKIGDFSYPIYLLHWPAGFLATMVLWGKPIRGFNPKGIISCLLAVLICFLISWLIIQCIDRPIQNLRARVKLKANQRLRSDAAACATGQ